MLTDTDHSRVRCSPIDSGMLKRPGTRSNRLGPDPDLADHLKYRPEPVRVPGPRVFREDLYAGVLSWLGVHRSGFLRPITDCRSQKAVSADPITDTDLFKAIFLSCRIIYSDTPISIFIHLFSA